MKARGAKKPTAGTKAKGQSLPFEAALGRLETITAQLERAEVPLDEALALYEEGVRLTRQCTAQLKQAERRVIELEDSGNAVREKNVGGVKKMSAEMKFVRRGDEDDLEDDFLEDEDELLLDEEEDEDDDEENSGEDSEEEDEEDEEDDEDLNLDEEDDLDDEEDLEEEEDDDENDEELDDDLEEEEDSEESEDDEDEDEDEEEAESGRGRRKAAQRKLF
jgi:exodeoxyribonuclease VII small subunit